MASVSISCPSCLAAQRGGGLRPNGKSTAGHQRYLCSLTAVNMATGQ
ncbi:IS1 family transposase [Escherichia coli]